MAVEKVDLLDRLVCEHHDRFVQLYPECAKIKPHLAFHIVQAIAEFKVLLACWSALVL